MAFFATPHKGGNGASLGDRVANVVTFLSGNLRNDILKMLNKDSKHLANLTADFAHQTEDYRFLTVAETLGLVKAPIRSVCPLLPIEFNQKRSLTSAFEGHSGLELGRNRAGRAQRACPPAEQRPPTNLQVRERLGSRLQAHGASPEKASR